MKDTTISCADHTFEPWRAHEERRVVLSESGWKEPERWNRQAEVDQKAFQVVEGYPCVPGVEVARVLGEVGTVYPAALVRLEERGIIRGNPGNLGGWIADDECVPYSRPRVFCASLADVFEDWQGPMYHHSGKRLGSTGSEPWVAVEDDPSYDWVQGPTMADVRGRLFRLIDATPNLDWLLLTKRPENIVRMWPGRDVNCLAMRENVWLGTSVSDQETADEQIPQLLACRDLAPVLFLSIEPLLGPVDLQKAITLACPHGCELDPDSGHRIIQDSTEGGIWVECACSRLGGIDWLVW